MRTCLRAGFVFTEFFSETHARETEGEVPSGQADTPHNKIPEKRFSEWARRLKFLEGGYGIDNCADQCD
jgi:hypothetical protein